MLGLNPSMRFYLCEGPVDMRKGIFTLAELVRKIMGKEPSAGDIFIFLSKDRRNIKILHHDTGGYVLYWKKLDKDRFLLPVFCKASHRYEIGWEKLVVLLQGTVRKELLVGSTRLQNNRLYEVIYLIINILICLKSCISQLYFVYLRHGRQGNDQHINRPATVKG